ncbi:MAG: class F sortase [Streptosporangiaceae bacterium]
MMGPATETGGARRRASRRPPPRHRRPPKQHRLAQSAGLVAMACGLLAIALGVGGWALAGQHRGYSPPAQSAGKSGSGTAGKAGERGSGGLSVPHGRSGRDGQVPVPRGLRGHGISGNRQQHVSRPTRLAIPAIGVNTSLIRLGITRQRTLQVPVSAAVAGWFTGSPRPGGIGASIIAGHIDSYTGPGVFFRLRDLHRGQRVYVTRANGSVATFRITAVSMYDKNRFPTAAVYGPVPDAELRLVTCGGQFDYATGSYLSNVVVYAVLAR